MADIRIDTSRLTYRFFQIRGQTPAPVDGSAGATLSLEPGSYRFQQRDAAFEFRVTQSGLIDYDTANDRFLEGRGTTTLTVAGFDVTVDLTALSHDLRPNLLEGSSAAAITRASPQVLRLVPGSYSFLLQRGGADFGITLSPDGQLGLSDPALAGCARIDGRRLIITGYTITFDLTGLSHDLRPEMLGDPGAMLSRSAPTQLTMVPGTYLYQLQRGVSTFEIKLTRDGQVRFTDPALEGCAHISGRTVTITGYTITFDLTGLSHDLRPEMLGDPGAMLSRSAPTQLTMVPGTYLYQLQRGVSTFEIKLTRDGRLEFTDPALAGCAGIDGRRLIITGYTITFDLTGLSHDLQPEMLGDPGAMLSRSAPTQLTMVPGTYLYKLQRGVSTFEIKLTRDGRLEFTDPALAGCAGIDGRRLIITGYTITFDLTGLSHDLRPEMLGDPGAMLSRSAPTQLTMVPGTYVLNPVPPAQPLRFTLDPDGTITIIDGAAGLTISLTQPVDRRID